MNTHCNDAHGPDTDISGIGVRLSFYAQAVSLALLSSRSISSHETGNALATLMITSLAYGVTTLVVGFKKQPGMSLYDALIVLYLYALSWIAVSFALPHYNRFKRADPAIQVLAILQSYFLFACTFAIFAHAPEFGANPECNDAVRLVVFAPFTVLKARIPFLVLVALVAAIYTVVTINDYRKLDLFGPRIMADKSEIQSISTTTPDEILRNPSALSHHLPGPGAPSRLSLHFHSARFDGRLIVTVSIILLFSMFAILNTELLRKDNQKRVGSGDGVWSFGQILPMFLAILPVINTLKAYVLLGCGPKPRRRRPEVLPTSEVTAV